MWSVDCHSFDQELILITLEYLAESAEHFFYKALKMLRFVHLMQISLAVV